MNVFLLVNLSSTHIRVGYLSAIDRRSDCEENEHLSFLANVCVPRVLHSHPRERNVLQSASSKISGRGYLDSGGRKEGGHRCCGVLVFRYVSMPNGARISGKHDSHVTGRRQNSPLTNGQRDNMQRICVQHMLYICRNISSTFPHMCVPQTPVGLQLLADILSDFSSEM